MLQHWFICPCVCVPRTPHGGLSDSSAVEIRWRGVPIEFPPGPDLDWTLRSAGLG